MRYFGLSCVRIIETLYLLYNRTIYIVVQTLYNKVDNDGEEVSKKMLFEAAENV